METSYLDYQHRPLPSLYSLNLSHIDCYVCCPGKATLESKNSYLESLHIEDAPDAPSKSLKLCTSVPHALVLT